MLLRKQTALAQALEATMEFAPSRVGYEAGVVLWWNQFSYATVGVTLLELPDGERVLTVVRRSPTGQPGVVEVSCGFYLFFFFFFFFLFLLFLLFRTTPSSSPSPEKTACLVHHR